MWHNKFLLFWLFLLLVVEVCWSFVLSCGILKQYIDCLWVMYRLHVFVSYSWVCSCHHTLSYLFTLSIYNIRGSKVLFLLLVKGYTTFWNLNHPYSLLNSGLCQCLLYLLLIQNFNRSILYFFWIFSYDLTLMNRYT